MRDGGGLDGADGRVDLGVDLGVDLSVDLDRMSGAGPAGGVLDPVGYTVTMRGVGLLDQIDVRCCVDWTEQRHHLAGPLGRALLARFLELGWLARRPSDRGLRITGIGRQGLAAFGVVLPD